MPLRDLNGKGSIMASTLGVHSSLTNAPSPAHLPPPAPDGNLWPERGTAFLFSPGYPSYTQGLQTSWSLIVEGNFSYVMTETLWSETSRQFLNLEVLGQLDTRDWRG